MMRSKLVPGICLGMPLYNSERFVTDALKSLLYQTYADFHLIAVDDCSTDKTGHIVQTMAANDRRITYIRNEKRLGLILNKRKTFWSSRRKKPDYFAWVADHDIWHPTWLQDHMEVLNHHRDVVLVYPLKNSIDADGKDLQLEPTRFETFGLNRIERIRAVCTKMEGAGNMVYGLFRADVLEKYGVFPYYAMPDRLLLMEMSAYGTYKQIPRYLWHRRYFDDGSGKFFPDYPQLIARQRSSLFYRNNIPWHSHVPTLGQAIGLVMRAGSRSVGGYCKNAFLGVYMALLHLLSKKKNLKIEIDLALRRLLTKINNL